MSSVSDVYQDLFDQRIYTGQGLYDVDAFVEALEGRVPRGRLRLVGSQRQSRCATDSPPRCALVRAVGQKGPQGSGKLERSEA